MTLQTFITYLLQEEILMKSLGPSSNIASSLCIRNKPTIKEYIKFQHSNGRLWASSSNATYTWKKKPLLQKAWSCAKELQQADYCRKTNTTSTSKLLYVVALV